MCRQSCQNKAKGIWQLICRISPDELSCGRWTLSLALRLSRFKGLELLVTIIILSDSLPTYHSSTLALHSLSWWSPEDINTGAD